MITMTMTFTGIGTYSFVATKEFLHSIRNESPTRPRCWGEAHGIPKQISGPDSNLSILP